MSPLELEVAGIIVEALNLEDVSAENIDPEAPLFNEGLGLDSIDALEIALVMSQRYGVNLKADDSNNKKIFSSLRSLAAYIESNKA